MTTSDCFELGYITRSHGLEGDVVAVLDTDNPGHYAKLKSVFLEIKGSLVPYSINRIKINSGKATLSLDSVINSDQADALKSCKLWLPLTALPKIKGDGYYFHELVGLTINDEQHGLLGKVSGIFNLPNQNLLAMDFKGSEVLIPLNDDIVKGLNRSRTEILTCLPNGLLEVYLEPEGEPDVIEPTESEQSDED